jgi:GNAT superfamily N-acetyltransferase
VSLDQIAVDPRLRGKGLARRALALLIEWSDVSKVALEPIPYKLPGHTRMPDEHLASWYKRKGFVESPTHDLPRRMVRAPRANDARG